MGRVLFLRHAPPQLRHEVLFFCRHLGRAILGAVPPISVVLPRNLGARDEFCGDSSNSTDGAAPQNCEIINTRVRVVDGRVVVEKLDELIVIGSIYHAAAGGSINTIVDVDR